MYSSTIDLYHNGLVIPLVFILGSSKLYDCVEIKKILGGVKCLVLDLIIIGWLEVFDRIGEHFNYTFLFICCWASQGNRTSNFIMGKVSNVLGGNLGILFNKRVFSCFMGL